jgi:16S rRNA (uracil1498-N3)-methyltransferase
MTRRRWIADEFQDDRAALLGDHASHLARVLRAKVGQEFDISIGDAVRHGRIISVSDDRVEFELGETIVSPTPIRLAIALSIFKFDRMEWAIEKCTELGVAEILPVVARRTDAHLADAAVNRVERWRRIAAEAAEQCRRARMPAISLPQKVKEILGHSSPNRIQLSENQHSVQLRDALSNVQAGAGTVLAIGPEGGWTSEEESLFRDAGWVSASLGNTVLRAETAAVAATAIVAAHCV